MKRTRILSLALVLLLAMALPTSAASKLNSSLIGNAKQALSLMSYGEYKKALKKLAFSANAPTASELSDFVDSDLYDLPYVTVQSSVGVAYLVNSVWRIAIPIEEPTYDSVQTFVLRAKNGQSFDSYKAMSWYDVLDAVEGADKVVWQDEYEQGDLYLVADE